MHRPYTFAVHLTRLIALIVWWLHGSINDIKPKVTRLGLDLKLIDECAAEYAVRQSAFVSAMRCLPHMGSVVCAGAGRVDRHEDGRSARQGQVRNQRRVKPIVAQIDNLAHNH